MEVTIQDLRNRYSIMDESELVELHKKGNLTNIASQALAAELQERKINPDTWTEPREILSREDKTESERKKGWKIRCREDALKVIKGTTNVFFVVAAIQAVGAAFLAPSMLLDAAIFAGLGLALRHWKSRTTAFLLMALSIGSLIMTVLNRAGVTAEGGSNIILAIILVWTSVKAVEATVKLHGKYRNESPELR